MSDTRHHKLTHITRLRDQERVIVPIACDNNSAASECELITQTHAKLTQSHFSHY
jgi:hypothetical protein